MSFPTITHTSSILESVNGWPVHDLNSKDPGHTQGIYLGNFIKKT